MDSVKESDDDKEYMNGSTGVKLQQQLEAEPGKEEEETGINDSTTGFTGVELQKQPEGESDELLEHPCQPCLSEEKHVESKKYCNECHEFLCEICIQFHKKVTPTKNHQLINKGDVNLARKKTIPTETCEQHADKELTFFCFLHDAVCCSLCKALEHKHCLKVRELKDCAAHIKNSGEFEKVSIDLEACLQSVDVVLSERKKDCNRVLEEKNASIKKLEGLRYKYIDIIDKLKSKDETKINKKHQDVYQIIQEDIGTCKEIASKLKEENAKKDEIGRDEVYQFINMQKVKTMMKQANAVIQAISNTTLKETVEYTEDAQIFKSLEGIKRLGILDQEIFVYSPVSLANKLHAGTNKSEIAAILIVDNGFVLATNWHCKSVKVINLEKNFTCSIITFDDNQHPFDICKVKENTFAVTLCTARCIQFLNLSDNKQLSRTPQQINTGEKCRGITCVNSRLFVCCAGYLTSNESFGHIRIFNIDGTLEKIIMNDKLGIPTKATPWTAIVCPASNCVYTIASYPTDTTFVKLTDDGKPISKPCSIDVESPGTITVDDLGNVFIADFESNTVKQFEANGKEVGTILSEKDGIKRPTALALNCETLQMFVAMEHSLHILIFQLTKSYESERPFDD